MLTVPSASDAALDAAVVAARWQSRLRLAQRRPTKKEERRRQAAKDVAASAVAAFAAAEQSGRQSVLLVRHGEAEHNANWRKHSRTADTMLTARGRAQAEQLASHAALADCTLLVVSPLSRAIETAALALGEAATALRRVCVCALHSERNEQGAACNRGSPKSSLAERFPFVAAWQGFDALAEEWWPEVEADSALAMPNRPKLLGSLRSLCNIPPCGGVRAGGEARRVARAAGPRLPGVARSAAGAEGGGRRPRRAKRGDSPTESQLVQARTSNEQVELLTSRATRLGGACIGMRAPPQQAPFSTTRGSRGGCSPTARWL